MSDRVSAFDVIRQEGPKWWNDPQQKDLRETLGMMVPQSPAELGTEMVLGPFGKAIKLGGLALAGAGYSPDAEAGILPMLARQGTRLSTEAQKKIDELLTLFNNFKIGRKQFYEDTGGIPLTNKKQDIVVPIESGKLHTGAANQTWQDRSLKGLPAAVKLRELYDNPTLQKHFPDIFDVPVVLADDFLVPSKFTPPGEYRGVHRGYEPALGGLEAIWLRKNPTHLIELNDIWPQLRGKYSLLEHEIYHALQTRGGMSTDYAKRLEDLPWKSRLDEIAASIGAQRGVSPETMIEQFDEVLGKIPRPSFKTERKLKPTGVDVDLAMKYFNGLSPSELQSVVTP